MCVYGLRRHAPHVSDSFDSNISQIFSNRCNYCCDGNTEMLQLKSGRSYIIHLKLDITKLKCTLKHLYFK